jgi:hypothetical protein
MPGRVSPLFLLYCVVGDLEIRLITDPKSPIDYQCQINSNGERPKTQYGSKKKTRTLQSGRPHKSERRAVCGFPATSYISIICMFVTSLIRHGYRTENLYISWFVACPPFCKRDVPTWLTQHVEGSFCFHFRNTRTYAHHFGIIYGTWNSRSVVGTYALTHKKFDETTRINGNLLQLNPSHLS